METELWTRWVGPSRIGYFVRRNACYLSLSCTEVSKTVEQLLGLFKWIDGALFDSFLKEKKSPAVSISGFNRNSNLCWTLYTLQFRTKIRFMFYFPDVMYREILTDFSSSSFLLYIYSDAIFIWDVFIYRPNIFDIFIALSYWSRHILFLRTVCFLLRRRARVLILISFIFKCRLLTLKERKRLIIFSVYFCTNIYQGGVNRCLNRCLDFLILRTRWVGYLWISLLSMFTVPICRRLKDTVTHFSTPLWTCASTHKHSCQPLQHFVLESYLLMGEIVALN